MPDHQPSRNDSVPLSNIVPSRQLSPAEQLVYSTVRIECEYMGGSKGTGTGFFFIFSEQANNVSFPVIVTNKHVIANATRGFLNIHLRSADGSLSIDRSERFQIENFQAQWMLHPDPMVDLCVMPIGTLFGQAQSQGKTLGFTPLDMSLIPTDEEFSEFTPFEEILMIGYPNGIYDSVNNMPILRRGITATHPGLAYEGRQEFMIDAACFPGSSGSPVMLYNTGTYFTRSGNFALGFRVKLLGVLYAGPQHTITGELQVVTIPTRQDIRAFSRIPSNLGVVIRSSRLQYFEEAIRRIPVHLP